MPKPYRREQIKKWFLQHPDLVVTPRSLSLTLKIPYASTVAVLQYLEASGFLVKLGFGKYKLNPRRKPRRKR